MNTNDTPTPEPEEPQPECTKWWQHVLLVLVIYLLVNGLFNTVADVGGFIINRHKEKVANAALAASATIAKERLSIGMPSGYELLCDGDGLYGTRHQLGDGSYNYIGSQYPFTNRNDAVLAAWGAYDYDKRARSNPNYRVTPPQWRVCE